MARSALGNRPPPVPATSSGGKLLLATGNPGKARELTRLLHGAHRQLVTLDQVGLAADAEETGASLEANATIKAQTYSRRSGLWAVADDSGLEVDALHGAPGPLSRRFAGDGASDQELVRHLLQRLQSVPWEQRGARFRCVIALASPLDNPRLYEGVCPGMIALEPRGAGGFGYDPVFFLPSLGRTMAELSLEEKNQVSHRAQAAQALVEALKHERIHPG